MSNKENTWRRTVAGSYSKSDRGDLTAVAGQQQCRKADLFQGVLSILFFWDPADLKTWTRQRVELEQYLSLHQLCQLIKVDKLLCLWVLLWVWNRSSRSQSKYKLRAAALNLTRLVSARLWQKIIGILWNREDVNSAQRADKVLSS